MCGILSLLCPLLHINRFLSRDFADRRGILHLRQVLFHFGGDSPGDGRIFGVIRGSMAGSVSCWSTDLQFGYCFSWMQAATLSCECEVSVCVLRQLQKELEAERRQTE